MIKFIVNRKIYIVVLSPLKKVDHHDMQSDGLGASNLLKDTMRQ